MSSFLQRAAEALLAEKHNAPPPDSPDLILVGQIVLDSQAQSWRTRFEWIPNRPELRQRALIARVTGFVLEVGDAPLAFVFPASDDRLQDIVLAVLETASLQSNAVLFIFMPAEDGN